MTQELGLYHVGIHLLGLNVSSFHVLPAFRDWFISNFSMAVNPMTDCLRSGLFAWIKAVGTSFKIINNEL